MDISRIEFDQCDEFPCIVHHGTTATGRAHMVANAATDSLTCKVTKILIFISSYDRSPRSGDIGSPWLCLYTLCIRAYYKAGKIKGPVGFFVLKAHRGPTKMDLQTKVG